MTREQVDVLARRWIESWNARDVEGVLSYFDDSVRFTSPRAAEITGRSVVEGKEALRAYWAEALARLGSLRFTLDRLLWDEERRTLVILYLAERNGRKHRACEILRFGAAGRAIEGEAMHGVPV